jgi:hypothetical protein
VFFPLKCQHITLMAKCKDSDRPQNGLLPPAKQGRSCPGFYVARPRDSLTQQATAGSSTSCITTLSLGASGQCLKAKHKERSHTPAATPATAPTLALTPWANSPNDDNLQAEDDHVIIVSSVGTAKPKWKQNNNAQICGISSSLPF